MKQFVLKITLLSILVVLPADILAQGSKTAKSDEKSQLLQQMSKQFGDEDYDATTETATKLLAMSLIPPIRNIVFYVRGRSLYQANFDNGKLRLDQSKPYKHSEEEAKNLKLAITDLGEVINYYKQNSPADKTQTDQQSLAYSTIASAYLNLGQYFSHQPTDFAKAEEFLKLALAKNSDPNWINLQLVYSLAGQYKFYEARDLAKKVLTAASEKDFQSYLGNAVEAFDMMGEYQFADAFLLEQGGIRKSANKSLSEISVTASLRQPKQKTYIEFANPTTVMELNRKGALLAMTQQCDKAMPLFDKSMGISENPTAARFAIQCLMQKNDYESVWQTANGLINLDKNDVVALSFRAILLSMQDDEAKAKAEKAEADLSKAIGVFPELASFYNALDNSKQIYQFQNKPNKVNEIAALEKKFGDLKGEIANSGKSDGIGDILDEDDAEEAKKASPKTPPTPTATPTPKSTIPKTLTPSPNKQLSDCRYIIDDSGCNKFFGMSKSKITSDFGIGNKYGSYVDIGIFFYLNGLENQEVVDEITFYGNSGESSQYFKQYFGQPAKNLDWNSTMEEVIQLYGEPTTRWQSSDKPQSSLRYDDSLRLEFEDNKLVRIVLRDPKADARYSARRAAESKKEAMESQLKETQTKAQDQASQMESDYNELLNQLDAKLSEGDRIIKQNMTLLAMGGQWAKDVQKKVSKVTASGDALIERFGKKYNGNIPAWMVKGIKDKWRPIPVSQ